MLKTISIITLLIIISAGISFACLVSVAYGQATIINVTDGVGIHEKVKCNWNNKNCVVDNNLTEAQERKARINRHVLAENEDLERSKIDKDIWLKFVKSVTGDVLNLGIDKDVGLMMANVIGSYYKGLMGYGMTSEQAFKIVIQTFESSGRITEKIIID